MLPDPGPLECLKLDEEWKGMQFDVLFQADPKNCVEHSLQTTKKFFLLYTHSISPGKKKSQIKDENIKQSNPYHPIAIFNNEIVVVADGKSKANISHS